MRSAYRTTLEADAASFNLGLRLVRGAVAGENEMVRLGMKYQYSYEEQRQPELDYLLYNDPVAYAELILNGDPETCLKTVAVYKLLDS